MRRLSHTALGLFAAISMIFLILGILQALPVFVFFGLMCLFFLVFNFIMSNFGALAMMPLGQVAGTAASTQGFLQMIIGASIGLMIGRYYDGTTIPLSIGFVVLSALAALIIWFGVGKTKQA